MTNSGGTITPERGKASRSTRSCRARGEAITAVAFTAARKKGDRSRRPRLAAECRARVHRPRFKGSCLRVRRRLPSLAHHAHSDHGEPYGGAAPRSVLGVLGATGRPLDPATRTFMESAFGHPGASLDVLLPAVHVRRRCDHRIRCRDSCASRRLVELLPADPKWFRIRGRGSAVERKLGRRGSRRLSPSWRCTPPRESNCARWSGSTGSTREP